MITGGADVSILSEKLAESLGGGNSGRIGAARGDVMEAVFGYLLSSIMMLIIFFSKGPIEEHALKTQ